VTGSKLNPCAASAARNPGSVATAAQPIPLMASQEYRRCLTLGLPVPGVTVTEEECLRLAIPWVRAVIFDPFPNGLILLGELGRGKHHRSIGHLW
jgi:hypothetical protein